MGKPNGYSNYSNAYYGYIFGLAGEPRFRWSCHPLTPERLKALNANLDALGGPTFQFGVEGRASDVPEDERP